MVKFCAGGWARWLPSLALDIFIGVAEVALVGGDVAKCTTRNVIWFHQDVCEQVSAFDIEEYGIEMTGDTGGVHRLQELRKRVGMVAEFVEAAIPRNVGDLLALMLLLKIVEMREQDGRTLWSPAEVMPSILALNLPPEVREKETELQRQYALKIN